MKREISKLNGLKSEEDVLFSPLDKACIPDISEGFKELFHKKLNRYSRVPFEPKRNYYLRFYFRVASVAAIFLLGIVVGLLYNRNDKIAQKNLQRQFDNNSNQLILSLLSQSSVSDRLQATNVSYKMSNINAQVISAIVFSLENDPDPNVRIRCAEILSYHVKPDTLSTIFEKSLVAQQDPFLQLLLINYLSSIDSPKALSIINTFVNSEKVDEFVRSEVKKSLNL